MRKLQLSLLKLLIFALPFGNLTLFGNKYLSISYVLIMIILLFSAKIIISTIANGRAMKILWPVYLMVILYIVMTIIYFKAGSNSAMSLIRTFTIQVVFFSILIAYNNVIPNLQRTVIKYFIYGIIVISMLFLMVGKEADDGRYTLLSINANLLAYFMTVSIICILHILLNKIIKSGITKLFLIIVLVFNFYVLLKAASISSLLALGSGLVILLLLRGRNFMFRIRSAVLLLVLLYSGYFLVIDSPVFYNRLTNDKSIESLNGRKAVWELGMEQAQDNWLFGVGTIKSEDYLVLNLGVHLSYHNEFLSILVYTGFFGLSVWLFFLFIVVKPSYNFYLKRQSGFPLALIIIAIVTITGGQFSFLFWMLIYLAYSISEIQEPKRIMKPAGRFYHRSLPPTNSILQI